MEQVLQDTPGRFRLLTIPLELRDMIYRLIFADTASDDGTQPNIAPPALMCTNKQVRDELLPIFYAMNRFAVSITTKEVPDFDAHVKILAANGFLKYLDNLTVSVKEDVTARDIRQTTKTIAIDFTTTNNNSTAQAADSDSTLVCDEETVDFKSEKEMHVALWAALKAKELHLPTRQSFAVSCAFILNMRDVLCTLGKGVPKAAKGVWMEVASDRNEELQSLRQCGRGNATTGDLETPPWWK